MMAFSSMWSVFFFAMVITLGIDSTVSNCYGNATIIALALAEEIDGQSHGYRAITVSHTK